MSRVPLRSPLDRLIVAGIALLITLLVGTLYIGWRYVGQRTEVLVEEELEARLRAAAGRLDGWSTGWMKGMQVESAYLSLRGEIPPLELADRWHAIMEAYWPVVAIRIADERGNEIALVREDSMIVLQETALGSRDGPPFLTRIDRPSLTTSMRTWIGERASDPRAFEWFGNALRNDRVDAVWSGPGPSDDIMHLSQLIRPDHRGGPYRILVISVDPKRSGSALVGHSVDTTSFAFIRLPSSTVIGPLQPSGSDWSGLMHEAVEAWRDRRNGPGLPIAGGAYRTRAVGHPLNGTSITVSAVVAVDAVAGRLATSRSIILSGLVCTVLLGMLLLVTVKRRRDDLLRLREEQERARAQQARLEKALGERDVLDRETHHRVKNNLQVVSSMLNLQAMRMEEGPVRTEFLRGKSRIDAMALVHQKLYAMPDLRGVDLQAYFEELTRAIAQRHAPRSHTISCEVHASGAQAATDPAIDLGIILCELVGNCYQHAFPYSTGGHIRVLVEPVEGDTFRLTVKDNGVGRAATARSSSLGTEIVEALAMQLDGSFEQRSNGGTTSVVTFRMRGASPG